MSGAENLHGLDMEVVAVLRALCRGAESARGVPLTAEAGDAARAAWGAAGAARLAGIARLLHALRLSRRSVFVYASPHCPCCRQRMTPNERAFVALVRAGLAGNGAAVLGAALILTEGGPTAVAQAAALDLAAVWARTGNHGP